VVDDNWEMASNTNQDDTLSIGDASVVVTADNRNASQDVSDETSLHIIDNCIVENTPPQNRKLKRHVVLGVWRDVKRLKGLGAHHPDLVDFTHVCRVVLPNGEPCSELLKLCKGKLLGKGLGTGSWMNT
jgi:hypothetical protein